ncbi:MAG: hypothetical protein IJ180_04200 [Bacteroidales bacterium]|nr:hypothetical protein [Bacteroidales bacterium]
MTILTALYEDLHPFFQWFDLIKTTIGVSSIYGIYSFLKNHIMKKRVKLSVGEFTIKKKDYTIQNVTNIVSNLFYGGGVIPDNIRKEILKTMCPKITNLKRK